MRPRRFASLCISASARQQGSLRKTYGYSRPFFISLGVVTISSRPAHGGRKRRRRRRKEGKGRKRRVEKEPRVRFRTGEKWCVLDIRIDEAIVEVPFETISNCCDDSLSREIVTRFWRGEEKLRIDNFYGNACIRDMINFSIFLCCSSSKN